MGYGVKSIVLKKRGGFAEPVLFLIIVSVEQQNQRSGLYSQGLWSVFDLIIGS